MEDYPLKWITDNVAVGYAPRSTGQLQFIANAGISAIVNLCAECYDLHEVEKHSNFEVFYIPVVDEEAPDIKQLSVVINWITLQKKSGKRVLIHCRYGIGRTGTIVLAYLLHCGVSFKEAQRMMEHTPSWPSTNAQKKIVDSYITELQGVSGYFRLNEKNTNSFGRFFRRLEAALKWDD